MICFKESFFELVGIQALLSGEPPASMFGIVGQKIYHKSEAKTEAFSESNLHLFQKSFKINKNFNHRNIKQWLTGLPTLAGGSLEELQKSLGKALR